MCYLPLSIIEAILELRQVIQEYRSLWSPIPSQPPLKSSGLGLMPHTLSIASPSRIVGGINKDCITNYKMKGDLEIICCRLVMCLKCGFFKCVIIVFGG